MADTLLFIVVLLQQYVVPGIYALGLIMFIYGFIQYFMIGKPGNDDDRMQAGREFLLRSLFLFCLGLFVYVLTLGLQAIANFDSSAFLEQQTQIEGGTQTQTRQQLLDVPNTPRGND